jgi:hypothetical protein
MMDKGLWLAHSSAQCVFPGVVLQPSASVWLRPYNNALQPSASVWLRPHNGGRLEVDCERLVLQAQGLFDCLVCFECAGGHQPVPSTPSAATT